MSFYLMFSLSGVSVWRVRARVTGREQFLTYLFSLTSLEPEIFYV